MMVALYHIKLGKYSHQGLRVIIGQFHRQDGHLLQDKALSNKNNILNMNLSH